MFSNICLYENDFLCLYNTEKADFPNLFSVVYFNVMYYCLLNFFLRETRKFRRSLISKSELTGIICDICSVYSKQLVIVFVYNYVTESLRNQSDIIL